MKASHEAATARTMVAGALCAAALGGCAVGPDYVAPDPNVPDMWAQEVSAGVAEGESHVQTWWTTLNDPMLDDIIARAAGGNFDLAEAFARIQEARALRGVATGERFPDVNGFGFYERNRVSETVFEQPPAPQSRTQNFQGGGFDATWEIDVWGRITRSIESTDAGLQASVEDYRDVLVVLYAEVATAYVDVRAFQARIEYSEANIVAQRDTLQLTEDRRRAELAPVLDVRQAELTLSETEAFLPLLRQGLMQSIHRVAVLLGEYPGALYDQLLAPAPIPGVPTAVSTGLPADLVRQRPDIRRAERELAAQTAQIGVATADLYPRFSLSGSFAFEGTSDLLDAGNLVWSWGPAFQWNLFDGGRVRNRIHVEEARTEQVLRRYEQTVLRALEEVENAVVAYREEQVRRDALERSVTAAAESVELVNTLYRTGLTDFQNVRDMEASLTLQQDAFAESQGRVVKNLIELYRALGGGWEPDPDELVREIEDQKNGEPVL